jgi:hypothetical protein
MAQANPLAPQIPRPSGGTSCSQPCRMGFSPCGSTLPHHRARRDEDMEAQKVPDTAVCKARNVATQFLRIFLSLRRITGYVPVPGTYSLDRATAFVYYASKYAIWLSRELRACPARRGGPPPVWGRRRMAGGTLCGCESPMCKTKPIWHDGRMVGTARPTRPGERASPSCPPDPYSPVFQRSTPVHTRRGRGQERADRRTIRQNKANFLVAQQTLSVCDKGGYQRDRRSMACAKQSQFARPGDCIPDCPRSSGWRMASGDVRPMKERLPALARAGLECAEQSQF